MGLDGNFKKEGKGGTNPVGDCGTHACDHGYGATVTESDHLLGYGLACHEDSSDVDFEH